MEALVGARECQTKSFWRRLWKLPRQKVSCELATYPGFWSNCRTAKTTKRYLEYAFAYIWLNKFLANVQNIELFETHFCKFWKIFLFLKSSGSIKTLLLQFFLGGVNFCLCNCEFVLQISYMSNSNIIELVVKLSNQLKISHLKKGLAINNFWCMQMNRRLLKKKKKLFSNIKHIDLCALD